jgi:hypothetical protein
MQEGIKLLELQKPNKNELLEKKIYEKHFSFTRENLRNKWQCSSSLSLRLRTSGPPRLIK